MADPWRLPKKGCCLRIDWAHFLKMQSFSNYWSDQNFSRQNLLPRWWPTFFAHWRVWLVRCWILLQSAYLVSVSALNSKLASRARPHMFFGQAAQSWFVLIGTCWVLILLKCMEGQYSLSLQTSCILRPELENFFYLLDPVFRACSFV